MNIFWGGYKRERRKKKRSRIVFPVGRFSRVSVEIRRLDGKNGAAPALPSTGMAFLHDLSPEGIGLFVADKFETGEEIALVLPVPSAPEPLRLQGRVAWCKEVPSFRILKRTHLPYRIGVHFRFTEMRDRQALELCCAGMAVRRFRGV